MDQAQNAVELCDQANDMKEKQHEHEPTGIYLINMIPPKIKMSAANTGQQRWHLKWGNLNYSPFTNLEFTTCLLCGKSQLFFSLHTQQTTPFNEADPAFTQYHISCHRDPSIMTELPQEARCPRLHYGVLKKKIVTAPLPCVLFLDFHETGSKNPTCFRM